MGFSKIDSLRHDDYGANLVSANILTVKLSWQNSTLWKRVHRNELKLGFKYHTKHSDKKFFEIRNSVICTPRVKYQAILSVQVLQLRLVKWAFERQEKCIKYFWTETDDGIALIATELKSYKIFYKTEIARINFFMMTKW